MLDELTGEWPLTGRFDILERFRSMCGEATKAANANAAGIALLGPAGVGKTRLAAVCLDEAAQRGWRTMRVAGSTAASSIPFGAAAPLLAPDEVGRPILRPSSAARTSR